MEDHGTNNNNKSSSNNNSGKKPSGNYAPGSPGLGDIVQRAEARLRRLSTNKRRDTMPYSYRRASSVRSFKSQRTQETSSTSDSESSVSSISLDSDLERSAAEKPRRQTAERRKDEEGGNNFDFVSDGSADTSSKDNDDDDDDDDDTQHGRRGKKRHSDPKFCQTMLVVAPSAQSKTKKKAQAAFGRRRSFSLEDFAKKPVPSFEQFESNDFLQLRRKSNRTPSATELENLNANSLMAMFSTSGASQGLNATDEPSLGDMDKDFSPLRLPHRRPDDFMEQSREFEDIDAREFNCVKMDDKVDEAEYFAQRRLGKPIGTNHAEHGIEKLSQGEFNPKKEKKKSKTKKGLKKEKPYDPKQKSVEYEDIVPVRLPSANKAAMVPADFASPIGLFPAMARSESFRIQKSGNNNWLKGHYVVNKRDLDHSIHTHESNEASHATDPRAELLLLPPPPPHIQTDPIGTRKRIGSKGSNAKKKSHRGTKIVQMKILEDPINEDKKAAQSVTETLLRPNQLSSDELSIRRGSNLSRSHSVSGLLNSTSEGPRVSLLESTRRAFAKRSASRAKSDDEGNISEEDDATKGLLSHSHHGTFSRKSDHEATNRKRLPVKSSKLESLLDGNQTTAPEGGGNSSRAGSRVSRHERSGDAGPRRYHLLGTLRRSSSLELKDVSRSIIKDSEATQSPQKNNNNHAEGGGGGRRGRRRRSLSLPRQRDATLELEQSRNSIANSTPDGGKQGLTHERREKSSGRRASMGATMKGTESSHKTKEYTSHTRSGTKSRKGSRHPRRQSFESFLDKKDGHLLIGSLSVGGDSIGRTRIDAETPTKLSSKPLRGWPRSEKVERVRLNHDHHHHDTAKSDDELVLKVRTASSKSAKKKKKKKKKHHQSEASESDRASIAGSTKVKKRRNKGDSHSSVVLPKKSSSKARKRHRSLSPSARSN